jgi:hypothetical protein
MSRKDVVQPIHRRHDLKSTRNPQRPRLDYNYDEISIDIESPDRPGSTFELQSPSRTMHRTRSSYDLQGSSTSPSSPIHFRRASLGALDIS